jgi:hypothetical protein
MIIALIALGYTMVYGIVEFINFSHGDLFMLASFLALTSWGCWAWIAVGRSRLTAWWALIPSLVIVPAFCGVLNWTADRVVYRKLREAPRWPPWSRPSGCPSSPEHRPLLGGLPMGVFGNGMAAAAPKAFPSLHVLRQPAGRDKQPALHPKELLVVFASSIRGAHRAVP